MKKVILTLTVGILVVLGAMALLKKKPEEASAPACPSECTEAASPVCQVIQESLPTIDRIHRLFTIGNNKLPIVETVTYSPRVSWLEGRAAWIADYAAYFNTSRHFIARSLNGKADYYTQKVSHGDRFNVFKHDKPIEFYLLCDLSRCQMHFYYLDFENDERVHLKTYPIGIGRRDATSPSGYLTPTGKYRLGTKVGIYKPGSMGMFQDNEAEMIQIFGTRWIPFGDELEGCTMGSRGYGLHGNPWLPDSDTGNLHECRDLIAKPESDGCIRLNQEDIEELFSIVITKPTTIDIVKSLEDAQLPGREVTP